MSKHFVRSLAALALCAFMMTGSALAQGRGHGRGAANGAWRIDRDGDRDYWRNRDWRQDHGSRSGVLDRWFFGDDDRRPPGWDRGRKTGWGNCDVPPGQAKKMGCNSTSRIFTLPRRDRDVILGRTPRGRRW